MKLRSDPKSRSIRMLSPTVEFAFIHLKTKTYELLMDEVQSSLEAAWNVAREHLPAMVRFNGKGALVYVDLQRIVEPETPEDLERMKALADHEVTIAAYGIRFAQAFTNPIGYEGSFVIGLNSIGPTAYGTRILHELLHQIYPEEEVVVQKLGPVEEELARRGFDHPFRRVFKAYGRTLPFARRLRLLTVVWWLQLRLLLWRRRLR